MSVSSSMTAIADKIRALLGLTGTMGLDAMAANLSTEQDNIANAFSVVSEKGGTVPASMVSGNLASAISSIPLGVTVERTSGTFTTNSSGAATVNCGFKPDFVVLYYGYISNGYELVLGFAFTERDTTKQSASNWFEDDSTYPIFNVDLTQTNTGFSVSSIRYDWTWEVSNNSRFTFNYIAIKYT